MVKGGWVYGVWICDRDAGYISNIPHHSECPGHQGLQHGAAVTVQKVHLVNDQQLHQLSQLSVTCVWKSCIKITIIISIFPQLSHFY